jgi:hypothetical protein
MDDDALGYKVVRFLNADVIDGLDCAFGNADNPNASMIVVAQNGL